MRTPVVVLGMTVLLAGCQTLPQVLDTTFNEHQVVFTSEGAIYTANLGNQQVTPVKSGRYVDADWAPDRRRLAATRDNNTNTGQVRSIVIMNVDGTSERELTECPISTMIRCHAYAPSWSPDGTKIAFLEENEHPGGSFAYGQLVVMGADGSGRTTIVMTGGGSPPVESSAWSPDGKKIVFSRGGQLHVIDADGRNERQVPTGVAAAVEPTWIRRTEDRLTDRFSEEKIAFVSRQTSGRSAIYMMDPDGRNRLQLTDYRHIRRSPSFSPTGARFMSIISNESGREELHMIVLGNRQISQPLTSTRTPKVRARW
jgi:Tol biopolymer transport system component